jgi:hypothetical protein
MNRPKTLERAAGADMSPTQNPEQGCSSRAMNTPQTLEHAVEVTQ